MNKGHGIASGHKQSSCKVRTSDVSLSICSIKFIIYFVRVTQKPPIYEPKFLLMISSHDPQIGKDKCLNIEPWLARDVFQVIIHKIQVELKLHLSIQLVTILYSVASLQSFTLSGVESVILPLNAIKIFARTYYFFSQT